MNDIILEKIIFTGDIHNMSMDGSDQKQALKINSGVTEVNTCEEYLRILNKYDFKPILFFTARCVIEEGNKIKSLMNKYNFFIGGHTYNAYKPKLLFRSFYRLFKTYYPLKIIQDFDIKISKKYLGTN